MVSTNGPPDDVDDWRELLPDREGERLSAVYDAFELALYADPDEFTISQGVYAALALMYVPMFVGGALWITIQVATGQLTVDQFLAAIEAARATSSTSTTSPFAFEPDWKELGETLLMNGLLVPAALGISLMVKTLLKAFAMAREMRR